MRTALRNHAACGILFLLFSMVYAGQLNAQQSPKTINLSEIYRDVIQSQNETLSYKDMTVVDDISSNNTANDPNAFLTKLKALINIEIPVDSGGIISHVKTLYLGNMVGKNIALFSLNLEYLQIVSGEFKQLTFQNMKADTVYMDSVLVKDTFIIDDSAFNEFSDIQSDYTNHFIYSTVFTGYYNMYRTKIHQEFYIFDSRFKEGAHIGPHFEGTFTDFLVENTVFEPIDSALPLYLPDISPDSVVYKTQVVFNFFSEPDQVSLYDNSFLSNSDEQHILMTGRYDQIAISGNTIQSHLYAAFTVNTRFDFYENEVSGNLILSDLIINGKNNEMHWQQFDGFKFAAATIPADMFTDPNMGYDLSEDDIDIIFRQTSNFAIKTYRGLTDEEFEDDDLFQRLISSYYRVYKTFKENGQITDANHTYVEMKDVQLRQLKYKYKTYGGLENFIQWRLNQLLRFYTDYGTNPARAIRISIFVVALFAIFYFFFPSEWDTKSKAQLIADYKVFIEKNDHGYFKPFLRLSGGFTVSLVNAFTLSLNSFVTLGFGSIPTTGLARYVCILQGFIGWFLLSVFTASLINQVMF